MNITSLPNYQIVDHTAIENYFTHDDLIERIRAIHLSIGWGASDTRILCRNLQLPSCKAYFLIKNGEELVGYVQAKKIAIHTLYISFIALIPSEQGKKHGVTLIENIFRDAKEEKLNVSLEFEYDNEQSRKFYENLPQKKTIHVEDEYGNGSPRAIATYYFNL